MRLKTVSQTLLAGVAVYALAAACSASERAMSANGSTSSGGASGGSVVDVISDAFDEMGDPVPEASAAPVPPDVATAKCDVVRKINGVDYWCAERTYPGKTIAQLALVHVVRETIAIGSDHSHFGATPWFAEGKVGYACAMASESQPTYTVTFVLPQ